MDEDYYDDFDQCMDEGSDLENWGNEEAFQDAQAEMREAYEEPEEREEFEQDFVPYDEEAEMERRAEYAAECVLGFGE